MAKPEGTAERLFLSENRDQLVGELVEWVSIPSIAGVAEHEADVTRSAHWFAAACREAGFPTAEVWPSGGTVAVFAQWHAAPDAPTVLVYSHHDVRAVKPENWDQTALFTPVVREGRVFGRGSSDAKAQALAHPLNRSPGWRMPRHRGRPPSR